MASPPPFAIPTSLAGIAVIPYSDYNYPMIAKNLFRRKTRTFLTMVGISIGVAAIIALGALARMFENSYQSMMAGSKSDLVLSQPDAFDVSYSTVDEKVGPELAAMPEVAASSAMLQGLIQAEGTPFFFIFAYPSDSYLLEKYQIIAGDSLSSPAVKKLRGKPVMIGSATAEALNKAPGDSMMLGTSLFRIVGVYQTGDALDDRSAVVSLPDAQALLDRPNQVSLYYIQLRSPNLRANLERRVTRRWPDLGLSGTDTFADKQIMVDALNGYVWVIAGLAIVIGGIGMMNAQLMSVIERTREIGVLRAVGWSGRRVLVMILGESLLISLLGGMLGVALGWLALYSLSTSSSLITGLAGTLEPDLILRAFLVVIPLGLIGGLYPAWRAARLPPVEALRYEGGTGGSVRRLPFGGLAVQNLWQRTGRTLLTLSAIGVTVGTIIALESTIRGAYSSMTVLATGSNFEIAVRQSNITDTSMSAIDERVGEKIAALPEVAHVSGMMLWAAILPESGSIFVINGYAPNEYAIRRFKVVEGEPMTGNHQMLLSKMMSDTLNIQPGDTLDLGGVRYRIVGLYETGVVWEEMGGVISLRDAQSFMGKPHKVMLYMVKVHDPEQAAAVVEKINREFPGVYAALSGEFINDLPDRQSSTAILNGISLLTILVGGLVVLNTMLMVVVERTREIGVLRALGWGRRRILGLILNEALLVGFLGGLVGIALAFAMVAMIQVIPMLEGALTPVWEWDIFARAILIALLLGGLGGLYPAYRATRLQPTEALRYE